MIKNLIEAMKEFASTLTSKERDIDCIVDYSDNILFYAEKNNLLNDDSPTIFAVNIKEDNFTDKMYYIERKLNVTPYNFFRIRYMPSIVENFKKDYPYSGIDTYINGPQYKQIDKFIYMYIRHPYIEKMIKCPLLFNITNEFILDCESNSSKSYSVCFKDGNNLEEITGLQKHEWQSIAEISDRNIAAFRGLKEWTLSEHLSQEDFDNIFDIGLRPHKINTVRKIIVKRFNKKRLFTTSTLLNYLRRIDMYQAINANDAVTILYDYLTMCYQMKIIPDIDSDSLKREHDVCVRNFNVFIRENSVSLYEKKSSMFKEVSDYLSKFEWSNNNLSAITAHSVRDIINEGVNNRNCVSCYIDSYLKGRANIFFIRRTRSIDNSYITIELNNDLTEVKQAYYSSNRPVERLEDKKFIKDWLKHIESVKANLI